jgi:hypothetical protein
MTPLVLFPTATQHQQYSFVNGISAFFDLISSFINNFRNPALIFLLEGNIHRRQQVRFSIVFPFLVLIIFLGASKSLRTTSPSMCSASLPSHNYGSTSPIFVVLRYEFVDIFMATVSDSAELAAEHGMETGSEPETLTTLWDTRPTTVVSKAVSLSWV